MERQRACCWERRRYDVLKESGKREKREAMTITRAGVWGVTASVWGSQKSVADGSSSLLFIISRQSSQVDTGTVSSSSRPKHSLSLSLSRNNDEWRKEVNNLPQSISRLTQPFNIEYLLKEIEIPQYYLRGPQMDEIPAAVNRQWRPTQTEGKEDNQALKIELLWGIKARQRPGKFPEIPG